MKTQTRIWAAMVILFLASGTGWAAFSTFLTMTGIAGDSQVSGHGKDAIINSFSWSVTTNNPGQPAFTLTLQKYVTFNSPAFAADCAYGTNVASATVACYKPGGGGTLPTTAFYSLSMNNVLVTSDSVTNDPGGSQLDETITLQFQAITWTYTPQNPDGSYGTPVVTTFTSP